MELTAEQCKLLAEVRQIVFEKLFPGNPDFCPEDGKCYLCRHDFIREHNTKFPIALITSCPKCHRSFCD